MSDSSVLDLLIGLKDSDSDSSILAGMSDSSSVLDILQEDSDNESIPALVPLVVPKKEPWVIKKLLDLVLKIGFRHDGYDADNEEGKFEPNSIESDEDEGLNLQVLMKIQACPNEEGISLKELQEQLDGEFII